MKSVNNQIILLKELLSKFVSFVYVSEQELESIYCFIFSQQSAAPISEDVSELYETAEYLRDLAQDSGYHTIEELTSYFEQQRVEVISLIEPLIKTDDNNRGLSSISLINIYNTSFKTESIKYLINGPVCTVPPGTPQIVEKLYQAINTEPSTSFINTYRPLNILRHCFQRLIVSGNESRKKAILPYSDYSHFNLYFKKFTRHDNGTSRFIYILKILRTWFNFFLLRKFIFDHDVYREIAKQRKKTKSIYKRIYESLQNQSSIDEQEIKSLISRMMLTAKLNNPIFWQYHSDFKARYTSCARNYYRYFADKKWSILKSPSGQSWLTTDNPGFSIDVDTFFATQQCLAADPYWTNMRANDMIYFPLSTEFCLRLEPSARENNKRATEIKSINFMISSTKEIEVVNKLSISTKPRVLLSEKTGIQLQNEQKTSLNSKSEIK